MYLRNLVRDRTCGSMDDFKAAGGSHGIAKQLNVDPKLGIKSSELPERREKYGSNAPPPVEKSSYLELFWDACQDFTVVMLTVAAIVSLIVAITYEKDAGHYAEAGAILLSVLIVTNVTAVNDYSKQRQFLKLNAAVEDMNVRCLRDGQVVDVKSSDLVAGDIVQLGVGDIFSVDGLLLQGDGVSADESALTGEPKLIRKDASEAPFLLSGTKVMEGSGLFVAIAVGPNSESGQIRELIRNKKKGEEKKKPVPASSDLPREKTEENPSKTVDHEKSVLTAKLDRIAIFIGKLASAVAGIALIVMCIRYAVLTFAVTDATYTCALIPDETCASQIVKDYFTADPTVGFPACAVPQVAGTTCCIDTIDGAEIQGAPCPWLKNHLGMFISFLITAITILIVAVPEGLPLAVTLSLAFSVRKMMDENNLVKHLDACETMGSATTICSDKTGTLTKNRMTVVKSMVGVSKSVAMSPSLPDWLQASLAEAISLAGSADIEWSEQLRLWDQIGSKTECAMLQCVRDNLGFAVDHYKTLRRDNSERIVKKFPFSSAAKKSSFIVKTADGMRIYTTGASEIVLEVCSSFVVADAATLTTDRLSPAIRKSVEKEIEEYARQAMRTIVVAFKDIPASINVDSVSADEVGQTFLCLVGIEDPLRDEVPLAIQKSNRAGVDVKMVTGDNLNTAIAIATKCGIIRESDLDPSTGEPRANVAMTGPDFRRRVLNADGNIIQSAMDEIWPHLRVLARSSPTDKYTLVTGMLESKETITIQGRVIEHQVIAVTGDGTNDAPALKKADVGFAMGITGTAVARDAADIILLDDNFASIVVACKWGRNVFESIQKFLQFQLTVNVVAVTIALEGAFIYNESPISAVQMLWVNLIMDALASLALATEPPTEALLDRPPHGRNESAVSGIMKWNIFGQSVFQLLILNGLFFAGPSWLNIESGVGKARSGHPTQHYTMMFNTLVLMQLTNQINSRRLRHELNVFEGFIKNPIFVGILFAEATLQALFVEFGGTWLHTAALSAKLWGISVAISVGSFPVQWMIVFVRRMSICFAGRRKAQQQTQNPKTDFNPHASVMSVLSPLPNLPKPATTYVDTEAGGVQMPERPAMTKQGSGNSLRAFSTKNLKDLVGAPNVEDLTRTLSGGFKNQSRQAATHKRFKKLNSFSDDPAVFRDAAQEYRRSNSGETK